MVSSGPRGPLPRRAIHFLRHQSNMPDAPPVSTLSSASRRAVIKRLKLGLDCLQAGSLVLPSFRVPFDLGVVVNLACRMETFTEASAEASAKSFSAAFWGSERLSRFARRSVLAAGVAVLLQVALINLVSSHVP
jgi:hypothetical protein